MSGLYALPIGDGADTDAYNFIIVAGVRSPGVASWSGASRTYNWDVKQTSGSQGATETYRGWKVSEGIKFTLQMWEASQLTFFYSTFKPLLSYDATKKNPKPISIQHPILMANDIFNVVTINIGELVNAGKQLWTVELEFTEYRPPPKKNATSTPNGTQNTSPDKAGSKPTAQDAQDQELARLTAEFGKPL